MAKSQLVLPNVDNSVVGLALEGSPVVDSVLDCVVDSSTAVTEMNANITQLTISFLVTTVPTLKECRNMNSDG